MRQSTAPTNNEKENPENFGLLPYSILPESNVLNFFSNIDKIKQKISTDKKFVVPFTRNYNNSHVNLTSKSKDQEKNSFLSKI